MFMLSSDCNLKEENPSILKLDDLIMTAAFGGVAYSKFMGYGVSQTCSNVMAEREVDSGSYIVRF